jgi:hypothetical protein
MLVHTPNTRARDGLLTYFGEGGRGASGVHLRFPVMDARWASPLPVMGVTYSGVLVRVGFGFG